MPRIPPLSRKADIYYPNAPVHGGIENDEAGGNALHRAIDAAVTRANTPRDENIVIAGLKIVANIWLTILPVVMVIGVVATIIAEYTPIFQWLSWPFYHYLNFLGIPEAAKAAPTMVVGFADVFLPFILGGDIESQLTRYVVGMVALVQIIFMTEVGALLLKSAMPVTFIDLVLIFIIRTVIAIPVSMVLYNVLV